MIMFSICFNYMFAELSEKFSKTLPSHPHVVLVIKLLRFKDLDHLFQYIHVYSPYFRAFKSGKSRCSL